eukprot:gene29958-38609_t
MRTKEIRNAFRNSIQPVYYFRNVVRIQRPSLEPVELGALRFAYPGLETGETTQWELYAAERGNRMDGPGCLNRFMRRAVFRRKPEDATVENPPRFLLVAKYPKYPTREMLDKGIGEASGAVARLQRLESNPSSVSVTASQRAPSTSSSSVSSVNRIGNATLEELTQLFRQTVSSRDVDNEAVTVAIARALLLLGAAPAGGPRGAGRVGGAEEESISILSGSLTGEIPVTLDTTETLSLVPRKKEQAG